MGPPDFQVLAQLLRDVIAEGTQVGDEVRRLRSGFQELHYCFRGGQFDQAMEELHSLLR